ncbi:MULTISPECIES: class I SAM-dependent methyltransferase [Prochlorococcus]|uniref:TPR repeat n=1 Tax=Prochlorococcus marinus str. MIT 9116 TaxID=167544 RepID=A0A0A1ZU66_PROMR|nr:class I SAM-dependent methyltransferase [Prochlorococcus marinus]KGF91702.1 TPR repeat [Prochlorococcus marinus str. MIT 9107]KGF93112.1 TPR repeat [Prochlorococcus marinus str. MIT 9116]KGF95067.1 TPR repeat [Prochlorococcus marinus str. MIT 9123]
MKSLNKNLLVKNLLEKLSRIFYYLTPTEFKEDSLINRLNKQKSEEIWDVFSNELKSSQRFFDIKSIRNYAINLALENDMSNTDATYSLEFGVWRGESANFFSKFVKEFYAFDSFHGFKEEWEGNAPKGSLSLGGKLPKLNKNVNPVIGYVENTLDQFLKNHNPKINFVHLDMDIYNPTKFTLEKIKPFLIKGSVIIFDELYNHINWKEGEYKALIEVFESNEFKYKAFNMNAGQVVIQIQ